MADLIIGLLFLAIGIVLALVLPTPKFSTKKSLLVKMLKSDALWGEIFTNLGLISIGIYCFELETITWKNGIFLFISVLSISDVITRIIKTIKQYKETK